MQETTWQFCLNGISTWEAMLRDAEAAKISIDSEQYIWNDDEIGKRFSEVFARKMKEGVLVRVLCDSVGSYGFAATHKDSEMAKAGVEILFFNPISPWRIHNFTSWFFRTHRKILVIDGKVGYTGGIGMNKDMANWRDTQVRITGPVVKEMEYSFSQMWLSAKNKRFFRFKKPLGETPEFRFLTNSPRIGQRFFYHSFVDALRSAKKYAYLTTPYFVPDFGFLRSVLLAAHRGVDVRLLLPKKSDHPHLIDIATRSHFGTLLRAGVKIYLYAKEFMHAKTAVIDGEWATAGSTNLDNQALLFNYEANIVSINRQFNEEIKNQFLEDLQWSETVIRGAWARRPLSQKILEVLTWTIHRFL